MKHLFFDFETMGSNVHVCPIIDCSLVAIDWERMTSDEPYSFRELVEMGETIKVSVKDQMDNYDCSFTKRDFDWWNSQGAEAKKKIKPRDTDLTAKEFCDNFLDILDSYGKIDYWWSRSNTFDPIVLWRTMKACGRADQMDRKLRYNKVRDVRTFIDAKLDFKANNNFVPLKDVTYWEKAFIAHDSRCDVAADIMRLQAIERTENDMEITDR